ncbi:MAG: HU family DNA-binding protein [bacterium]
MAKMTKSQLISALAEKAAMPKKAIKDLLEMIVNLAYHEVKVNGELTIPGLGKMQKKHRAERMGRNPATGVAIKIPAKTVLKFRVAKAAKEAIL